MWRAMLFFWTHTPYIALSDTIPCVGMTWFLHIFPLREKLQIFHVYRIPLMNETLASIHLKK